MNRQKPRLRVLVKLLMGLALATAVATGTQAFTSESGGFYCGYGQCTLQYWDCAWASWEPLENGNCVVTIGLIDGCGFTYWCEPGSSYWWEEDFGNPHVFGTKRIDR